jgi:hypothetical protein
MSDVFCHLRSSECGCEIHHCAAAPVEELVYRPTVRDTLAVAFFITIIAGFITFAVAAAMERPFKNHQLDQQEVIAYGQR